MTPKEQALKTIEGKIEAIQNLSIECIDYIYLAAHNEALELAARTFELKDYKLNDDNLDNTQQSSVGKQESLSDFDKAKVGYDKISVFEKEIWNTAIEAAAKLCDKAYENATWSPAYQRPAKIIGEKIRKLKK